MAARNTDILQDIRIQFRVGIHVGDIIIDDNDIFGDGVNIAARLEGIAEPGGVCISDDAQRQIRGKVDIGFDDMGTQNLKNIVEPMRAWRLRLNGDVAKPLVRRPGCTRLWRCAASGARHSRPPLRLSSSAPRQSSDHRQSARIPAPWPLRRAAAAGRTGAPSPAPWCRRRARSAVLDSC
jgi:hypothetical protein